MGAPPDVAVLLEEMSRERRPGYEAAGAGEIGLDPELDEFMVRAYSTTPFTELASSLACSMNQYIPPGVFVHLIAFLLLLLHVERWTDDHLVQEAYCRVLWRYKEELSRPLDEAASFLATVRTQLSNLCGGGARATFHSGDYFSLRS